MLKNKRKNYIYICFLCLLIFLLSGCDAEKELINPLDELNQLGEIIQSGIEEPVISPVTDAKIEDMELRYTNEASGIAVEETEEAVIDYSNASDGYVMVLFRPETEVKLKIQVQGEQEKYNFTPTAGQWVAVPLTEGSGVYTISLFENVESSKYAQILSVTIDVLLEDELSPFLRPNLFISYDKSPNTVATARLLTEETTDMLGKVESIYNFVTQYLSYDTELAASVELGYIPDTEKILQTQKGICFDYAALMTGMLRSVDVPCKLVIGYAGEVYHAWISVWVDEEGWVNDIIYFDGQNWQYMDPTFASTLDNQKELASYMGDGNNYVAQYYY